MFSVGSISTWLGAPMRWGDFIWICITLNTLDGLPKVGSSSKYGSHTSNRRWCGYAAWRLHASSRAAVWLAMVDRRKPCIQSRARVICKAGACAERRPKRYKAQKIINSFSKRLGWPTCHKVGRLGDIWRAGWSNCENLLAASKRTENSKYGRNR